MTNMLVPILLGGESDREWAKKITDELDKWGIPHKVQGLFSAQGSRNAGRDYSRV